MEATEKNAQTVNEIIKLLEERGYTVQEAYSILDFTKGRIGYTSKVGMERLTFAGMGGVDGDEISDRCTQSKK